MELDEHVLNFVSNYMPSDTASDTLLEAFSLLQLYEVPFYNDPYVDILSRADSSSFSIIDLFRDQLHTHLDFIFTEHRLEFSDTASMEAKIELIRGLFLLDNITEVSYLLAYFESTASVEEKISYAFSEVTKFEELEIMDFMNCDCPHFLEMLKKKFYEEESRKLVKNEVNEKLIENYKDFVKFCNRKTLGGQLVETGIPLGLSFKNYLPYVKDNILSDTVEQTAYNYLSVLLMSPQGYNSCIIAYRKTSDILLPNLDIITRVEVALMKIFGEFTAYRRAKQQ